MKKESFFILKKISEKKKKLRAGFTGDGRKKEQEIKNRISELSQEKKTLERAGTFSASELKQFEIDDARSFETMYKDMSGEGLQPVLNDYVYV